MADSITILRSKGPVMAKRWTQDGIKPYDRAKNFTAHRVPVGDIYDLSRSLTELAVQPTACVIRGEHRSWLPGQQPDPVTGEIFLPVDTTRDLESFAEVPRRWICIDVDNFQSQLSSPQEQIDEYIRTLPAEFQSITYHYQLSNSYGKPGAERVLKAHLWFWLDRSLGQAELEHWARATKAPVDLVTFRTVQVHYTSDPIIDEGVQGPVLAVRSGLVEGAIDDVVRLVIPPMPEAAARRADVGRGLVDPRTKPGVVGAFCRAFELRDVLAEHLAGVFEPEGDSQIRLTWLQGSGAVGGAVITDDDLHVYNSHNTDPAMGAALNAFDLCRVHLFGDADNAIPYEQRLTMSPHELPSHKACAEWAMTLPGVAAEMPQRETATQAFGDFDDEDDLPPQQDSQPANAPTPDDREQAVVNAIARINAQANATELESFVKARLAPCVWTDGERARLTSGIRARYAAAAGAALPAATVRSWLTPPATETWPDVGGNGQVLGTLANMRHLLSQERITAKFNLITKEDEIDGGWDVPRESRNNTAIAQVFSHANRAEMRLQINGVKMLLNSISAENAYNPAYDWVTSKPWDGVDRIQALCDTVAVGPSHGKLRDLLIRRWLIQAAAILQNTGTMMARGVLVFQGAQYQGKTKWLRSLAPEVWVGTGKAINPHDKDSLIQSTNKWLVELGELDATFRKADIAALKAFISNTEDEIRRPYAPSAETFPRRTCFFATVNEPEFLSDPTGSTRFWVLPVISIRADHGIDTQQIWAQAMHLVRAGEQHWATDEEIALVTDSNQSFEVRHAIQEEVLARLDWEAPQDRWLSRTATQICTMLGLRNPSLTDLRRASQEVKRLNGGRRSLTRGLSRYPCPPVLTSISEDWSSKDS